MKKTELNNLVLLLVVLLVSGIFLAMISDFLLVILVAAIFSGLAISSSFAPTKPASAIGEGDLATRLICLLRSHPALP